MSKQHLLLEESDSLGIWFVRHAESEANVHRIYANTGASFPLTANGVQEPRTLAKRLSSAQIRAIYTSPLLRATQTAEELCKTRKMKIQIAPELIEYSAGIYEGTSTLADTAGAIADGEIKTRWFEYNDFDACLPGGESLNDMRRRFLPLVKQTIEDASEPGIILLITHSGILEAMLPFVFENVDFNFTRTHPIGNIHYCKRQAPGWPTYLSPIQWQDYDAKGTNLDQRTPLDSSRYNELPVRLADSVYAYSGNSSGFMRRSSHRVHRW